MAGIEHNQIQATVWSIWKNKLKHLIDIDYYITPELVGGNYLKNLS